MSEVKPRLLVDLGSGRPPVSRRQALVISYTAIPTELPFQNEIPLSGDPYFQRCLDLKSREPEPRLLQLQLLSLSGSDCINPMPPHLHSFRPWDAYLDVLARRAAWALAAPASARYQVLVVFGDPLARAFGLPVDPLSARVVRDGLPGEEPLVEEYAGSTVFVQLPDLDDPAWADRTFSARAMGLCRLASNLY